MNATTEHSPHKSVIHWEGMTPDLLPWILGMTPEELLKAIKKKADERKNL